MDVAALSPVRVWSSVGRREPSPFGALAYTPEEDGLGVGTAEEGGGGHVAVLGECARGGQRLARHDRRAQRVVTHVWHDLVQHCGEVALHGKKALPLVLGEGEVANMREPGYGAAPKH